MRTEIDLPELAPLLATADHVDVKTAEADSTLAEFIANALGRPPGLAMRALFRARGVLARVLRLREPDVPPAAALRPDQVPFTPGGTVGLFTVADGSRDRFLLLSAADNHLTGYLAVVVEPAAGGRTRFLVATVVKYHRWTGPLYFNLIRPFHHLVVRGMIRAGTRPAAAPGALARWTPRLMLIAAALHLTVAVAGSPSWHRILTGGVWNTVGNDDYAAMTTLWFTLGGVALAGLALQARRSVRDTGRMPAVTGWILLALGIPISVLEPVSGGWLVIVVGVLAALAARSRPARPA